jgi:8-oxo-dGTP pyrophosphatase MutT (NUDIX family)
MSLRDMKESKENQAFWIGHIVRRHARVVGFLFDDTFQAPLKGLDVSVRRLKEAEFRIIRWVKIKHAVAPAWFCGLPIVFQMLARTHGHCVQSGLLRRGKSAVFVGGSIRLPS